MYKYRVYCVLSYAIYSVLRNLQYISLINTIFNVHIVDTNVSISRALGRASRIIIIISHIFVAIAAYTSTSIS